MHTLTIFVGHVPWQLNKSKLWNCVNYGVSKESVLLNRQKELYHVQKLKAMLTFDKCYKGYYCMLY